MVVVKWIAIGAALILILAALVLLWLVNSRADLSEFDEFYAPEAEGGVTVRFFGTSSLLFSDGDTDIMIDGWFSRPSTASLFFGEVLPDTDAIAHGLQRLGNPEPAALIPVHTHLDHAMDVAEVAKATGALLVGSESAANIGRGGGLAEDQIRVVAHGDTLQFGDFAVTFYETGHFVSPAAMFEEKDPLIRAPITPPAPATAYKGGKTFSLLIEHPEGRALIQSSAGFREGALRDLDVNVVYLGVGFLASQTPDYQDAYWREAVSATRPDGIYLIHWDSFSRPLDKLGDRPAAPNRLWSSVFGMKPKAGLEFGLVRAKQDGIPVALLPMWTPVAAFRVTLPSQDLASSE